MISEKELEQNSLEEKLLDIMLHDAYHTGQIIQLRKMQGHGQQSVNGTY